MSLANMDLHLSISVFYSILLFTSTSYLCYAADGETDQWDAFCKNLSTDTHLLRDSNFITGDFDSIDEDSFEYYYNSNFEVVESLDPSYSDFSKAKNDIIKKKQKPEVTESEDEDYNFFTFNNVLIHVIVFFACFLLY